jgi:hypothetical protein
MLLWFMLRQGYYARGIGVRRAVEWGEFWDRRGIRGRRDTSRGYRTTRRAVGVLLREVGWVA